MSILKRNNRKIIPKLSPINISPRPKEKARFITNLKKYSELIIGGGIFLYIIGFIIENIYLGSLGVAFFDIIRVRYILIGSLFFIFFFSVAIPTFDVVKFYVNNENARLHLVALKILKNGFWTFGLLLFGTKILELLSGPESLNPFVLSKLNSSENLLVWFEKALPSLFANLLKLILILYALVIILLILIFIILLIFNPKLDSKRVSRKAFITDSLKNIKKTGFSPIIESLGVFSIAFLMLPIVISFIVFLTSNEIQTKYQLTLITISPLYLRIILAVLACYIGISSSIIILFYNGKVMSSGKPESPNLLSKSIGWVYLLAIILSFLIPIYSYGIYPLIPQQIGGGLVIPIDVTTKTTNLQEQFQKPLCDPYLLDRTSSALLIICNEVANDSYQIKELQLGDIELITFKRNETDN